MSLRYCVIDGDHMTAGCPESVYMLMLACWKLDTRARVSAESICSLLENMSQPETWGNLEWPHAVCLVDSICDTILNTVVVTGRCER